MILSGDAIFTKTILISCRHKAPLVGEKPAPGRNVLTSQQEGFCLYLFTECENHCRFPCPSHNVADDTRKGLGETASPICAMSAPGPVRAGKGRFCTFSVPGLLFLSVWSLPDSERIPSALLMKSQDLPCLRA